MKQQDTPTRLLGLQFKTAIPVGFMLAGIGSAAWAVAVELIGRSGFALCIDFFAQLFKQPVVF